MIAIQRATTPDDIENVHTLFSEYARTPDLGTAFATCLSLQDFQTELQTLPGAYAPPEDCLLLALADGEPAGCIALKALAELGICEMKRLYVREAYRSLGVGRELVEQLLAEARTAGYSRMRLDTLPSMQSAQRLYRSLGFYEIPQYCINPVPGATFMECELQDDQS